MTKYRVLEMPGYEFDGTESKSTVCLSTNVRNGEQKAPLLH